MAVGNRKDRPAPVQSEVRAAATEPARVRPGRRRLRLDPRGQGMVEFAISFPVVMLMILFGVAIWGSGQGSGGECDQHVANGQPPVSSGNRLVGSSGGGLRAS